MVRRLRELTELIKSTHSVDVYDQYRFVEGVIFFVLLGSLFSIFAFVCSFVSRSCSFFSFSQTLLVIAVSGVFKMWTVMGKVQVRAGCYQDLRGSDGVLAGASTSQF